jgi:hypothetical protein
MELGDYENEQKDTAVLYSIPEGTPNAEDASLVSQ